MILHARFAAQSASKSGETGRILANPCGKWSEATHASSVTKWFVQIGVDFPKGVPIVKPSSVLIR